jgi:hypothetical protein
MSGWRARAHQASRGCDCQPRDRGSDRAISGAPFAHVSGGNRRSVTAHLQQKEAPTEADCLLGSLHMRDEIAGNLPNEIK